MSGKPYPVAPQGYNTTQQSHLQYPAQQYYPQQAPPQPLNYTAPPAYGAPNEAPPPYTQHASQPGPYGGSGPYQQQAFYPLQQNVQLAACRPGVVPQGAVSAQFDSGARFDGISQPRIPPPPPGYAPNQAQQAAMQGQNIIATQRPTDWFSGGSGGGYTFF